MKKTLLLFTVLILAFSATAQQYSTKSKKAIKRFEKSLSYYQGYHYPEAIEYAQKALKADKKFVEVYHLLSDIYSKTGDLNMRIESLRKAIEIAPEKNSFVYLKLARTEMYEGLYAEAETHIVDFEKRNSIGDYKAEIKDIKARCKFAQKAIANPLPFSPKNCGANINTEYDEYQPSLSADEETFVFTTGLPRPGKLVVETIFDTQEDFFITKRNEDNTWTKAKNVGLPINTNRNEGAQSISADGKLLFFTACEDRSKYNPHGKCYGRCDIYFSERKANGKWTKPQNVGPEINTIHRETQPSISADGNVLYFVSQRPGGKGGSDIWFSERQANGKWGKPKNAGDKINTEKSEQYPFIHLDGKTLYFASQGHVGMGKYDLFMSRQSEKGEWATPKNLGYPINDKNEQGSMIVNAAGTIAYYSSWQDDGFGRLDLYEFELDKTIRPNPVTFVKGKVYDAETRRPLAAKFELINVNTNKLSRSSTSDKADGKFLITLPTGNIYALNIAKKGYLFYSENFTLNSSSDSLKEYFLEAPLQPIKYQSTTVLKNVFFETDSHELKAISNAELNKLAEFLKKNPTIKIELSGHTDNTGNKKHNLELSKNRAKSVYDFLVTAGISADRMTFKGYADTKAIDDNSTPEGRANNRRTEFMVIK